jgi:hypothetical protein
MRFFSDNFSPGVWIPNLDPRVVPEASFGSLSPTRGLWQRESCSTRMPDDSTRFPGRACLRRIPGQSLGTVIPTRPPETFSRRGPLLLMRRYISDVPSACPLSSSQAGGSLLHSREPCPPTCNVARTRARRNSLQGSPFVGCLASPALGRAVILGTERFHFFSVESSLKDYFSVLSVQEDRYPR